jgi:hypothetical protein
MQRSAREQKLFLKNTKMDRSVRSGPFNFVDRQSRLLVDNFYHTSGAGFN